MVLILRAIGGGKWLDAVGAQRPRRLRSVVGVFASIFFILCLLLIVSMTYSDLQLNASFQQRLTVLAPKIDEVEYRELQAVWAGMRSRADFVAVNTRMERLAEQHGIDLPKLLR